MSRSIPPEDPRRALVPGADPDQRRRVDVRLARPGMTYWICSHNTLGVMTHWLIIDRTKRPIQGRRVPCTAHLGRCIHCAGQTDSHKDAEWCGYLTVCELGLHRYAMLQIRHWQQVEQAELRPQWKGSLRGRQARLWKDGTRGTSPIRIQLGDRGQGTPALPADIDRTAWLLTVWGEHARADLCLDASDSYHLLRPWEEPESEMPDSAGWPLAGERPAG